ncbi:MAG: signal transduction histidine kinase/Tfp pilus assembly protein PilF [Chitinophagales bacterium]|jgi:signal transduction histidine kinase/Tfp pilus assembly protein PilF
MISSSREERELELLHNEVQVLVTRGDADDSMPRIKIFLEKAKSANSLKFMALAHSLKGYVYYGLNETKLAIDSFEKAIEIYSTKKEFFFDEIKQANNSLGALYKNLGEYKNALVVLFDSIEISERYSISNSIAYNNIATIYFKQENYKKALEYYQRAIEVENDSETSNRSYIIKYLSNIASLHVKLGNIEEADKIYNKTYKYCEENNELSSLVQSLKGLGILYLEKSDFDEAEIFFNRAITLSKEIDFKVHLVDLSLYLADVYEKTKRSSLQLNSLKYALKVAQESYIAKEILVYENLHDFYYKSGNVIEAYEILKKLFIINKQKFLKEKEENLLEMQEKFESEQKDKLIKQEKAFNEKLKEKNQKLAELNDDLAQFNHGVSHDLKEPIRLVKGRLTYLQSITTNKLDLREQESLEIAQEAAERMEKMLEDLHGFSTLGGNLKDAKDIDLNEVLAIVQADLQMRIRESEARVEVKDLPVVRGYKSMYVQLFQNLVNNALKFRREGVSPIVKVEYKPNEDWHVIHVQDNGVGIMQQDIPQVFKLFKRLKETDYRDGSGVGLSIVQKIIKKMQGEISLASVHGSGTTFIIKLPKS